MKKLSVVLLLLGVFLFHACQKEVSFESGSTPSEGSLQFDGLGDCMPKNVVGTYVAGTALSGATDYIEVTVDVTTSGSYTIYTDTVNGVYFRATGIFTTTGSNVVKLRGYATPAAEGTFNFTVYYGTQSCAVPVDFLPVGTGGPAAFTLTCTPAPVVEGAYVTGTPLNSTNKVTVSINVTTVGTYNLSSTTVNGMTFSGSGTLTATGPATIVLTGSGTPVSAATSNLDVTVGATTCSFPVTVTGPATFTVDCGSAVISGTYMVGQALTSGNTVVLNVNVTAAGAYSISTTDVNGMVFAGSGNLAVGPQTITLTATGTPTTAGAATINVNAGTAPCTFQVTVSPPGNATGTWQFTEGATTYSGTISEAGFDNTSFPPYLIFYLYGTSATGEEFEIDLVDVAGGVTTGELYTMVSFTGAANAAGFYFVGIPPKTYDADPTIAGNTMTTTVTSHNVATKTITGTFSGKAADNNGVLKDITNGTYTVTYQ